MRALRFGSLWLSLGYLMVAVMIAASLLPVPQMVQSISDKLLHLLAYLVLAVWFGAIYRREHFLRVGLALVLLGVLVECLQSMTRYRSFELADMAVDTLGTVVGLLLAATPLGGALQWLEHRLPGRG